MNAAKQATRAARGAAQAASRARHVVARTCPLCGVHAGDLGHTWRCLHPTMIGARRKAREGQEAMLSEHERKWNSAPQEAQGGGDGNAPSYQDRLGEAARDARTGHALRLCVT